MGSYDNDDEVAVVVVMTCQVYAVEYVDDRPEEVNFLRREGDVKISYPTGDSFEGTVAGSDRLKQGEGKYTWRQKGDDDERESLLAAICLYVWCLKLSPRLA